MDPFPSTLAGSSKRGRTPSTGAQPVSCLVDGCNSDLSKCRDYHRRHKVCEMHSKTPRVTIAGHQQRFCQQCSRFHSLGEFDEGKRSCRKRLEGHNRRRRKPQPVNHANFPSSIQGSRFFPLSNQPMIPTASSVVSKNVSNHDTNTAGFFSSSPISDSYLHPYRSTRQFSFTGSSSPAQMFHNDHNSVPGNGSDNNGRFQLLYDGTSNQGIDAVSNRALSLLSSSPADTWEMGLGRSIHNPSPVNPTRPMISGLQYLDPQHQGLEGPPGNSGLIPSNNSLCQNVFTGEADGSSCSSGGGHQTLSFSWG